VPQTIAVVEDDAAVQQLLQLLLTDAGYRVIARSSSAEAYEMIRTERPAMLILDMWLEHRDAGGQLLAMIERDPSLKAMPVLICSAGMAFSSHTAQMFREHGHTVVKKPFDPPQLLATINDLMANRSDSQCPHHES
jgi:CheY-like chemotaxis protein